MTIIVAMTTDACPPGLVDCPACDGAGSVAEGRRIPSSYFAPAEHDSRRCDRCGGSGEVLDPDSDAVDLRLAAALDIAVRCAARLLDVRSFWAGRGDPVPDDAELYRVMASYQYRPTASIASYRPPSAVTS